MRVVVVDRRKARHPQRSSTISETPAPHRQRHSQTAQCLAPSDDLLSDSLERMHARPSCKCYAPNDRIHLELIRNVIQRETVKQPPYRISRTR